jgi:hypothetical protein
MSKLDIVNLYGPMTSGKTTTEHIFQGLFAVENFRTVNEYFWLPAVEVLHWALDPANGDRHNAYKAVGHYAPKFVKSIILGENIHRVIVNAWIPFLSSPNAINIFLTGTDPLTIAKERLISLSDARKHHQDMIGSMQKAISQCIDKSLHYTILAYKPDYLSDIQQIAEWMVTGKCNCYTCIKRRSYEI